MAFNRFSSSTMPSSSEASITTTLPMDRMILCNSGMRVLLVDTSTYHYKSRRHGQAPLEQRIKEICQTRVRYG